MSLLDDTMEAIRAGLCQKGCSDEHVEEIINNMSYFELLTMISQYLEEQKYK